MPRYKCDACGNCVCYSEPKEDWGTADICTYDVGFPVNWRKVRKTAHNTRRRKPVKSLRKHTGIRRARNVGCNSGQDQPL
jgi:hypothetical protein